MMSPVDDSSSAAAEPPPASAVAPTLTHGSSSQYTRSQLSHTYAPSISSQTFTQSLSSGTLYNGARTIMEIGSSTGTDIVASTLSFRGTASASLLGDSCAPSIIDSASTVNGREYYSHRIPGPSISQTSASGYIAEVDEPAEEPSPVEQPQSASNVSEDIPQGPSSHVPQEQLAISPAAEQSDSDYVTAASPTASFVSLSGMSAFPDEDEEEQPVDEPALPSPVSEGATPVIEFPPTPSLVSEADIQTIGLDDGSSTEAPLDCESTIDDKSRDSDASTSLLGASEDEESPAELPIEPAPVVETPKEPEPEIPIPPPVLRVDACTQADVEDEEPAKDDTPQPEQIPLPAPADTVYSPSMKHSPSVKSIGISPIPLVEPLEPELEPEPTPEPEITPDSPRSEVLSTLSAAVPELSQLPSSTEETIVEPDTQSSHGSLGIIAGTPMPSLTSDSLSDSVATPEPAVRSPSVVESAWPAETDRSYESSVLNASPSMSTVARTSTEYIGVAQSPAISDVKTPASLLKSQAGALPTVQENDAMSFGSSEEDSVDDASTPTASSWVSSLPPSVPSNTLNDVESVRRDLSAVDEVQSIGLASSSSELSVVGHEQTPAKTFSEEGCQVELIVENAPVSDHRLKERLILMLDLSCLLA